MRRFCLFLYEHGSILSTLGNLGGNSDLALGNLGRAVANLGAADKEISRRVLSLPKDELPAVQIASLLTVQI